jgi:hypothetical protein
MDKADEILPSGRQQSWEPGSHGEENLRSCPHERSANSAASATEQMLFHMTDDGSAFRNQEDDAYVKCISVEHYE